MEAETVLAVTPEIYSKWAQKNPNIFSKEEGQRAGISCEVVRTSLEQVTHQQATYHAMIRPASYDRINCNQRNTGTDNSWVRGWGVGFWFTARSPATTKPLFSSSRNTRAN